MYETKKFTSPRASDISMNYIVTTPSDFDPSKEKLPLIIFLHGAGERGTDAEIVRIHGIPKYFTQDRDYKGLRVVTLSPQCPNNMVWNNIAFDVKALIDTIVDEYNCDKDCITLTGLSMGGFGTWELGMLFPNYFAALAPICGGGMSWRAPLLANVPVRAFHGDDDTLVPPLYSEEMVRALKEAGGKVELTYFHNVGHASWVNAYGETDLIEWLAAQKKSC